MIDLKAFAAELRKWWSFDSGQMHTHSWHCREDFIEKKLPGLLHDEPDRELQKFLMSDDPRRYREDHLSLGVREAAERWGLSASAVSRIDDGASICVCFDCGNSVDDYALITAEWLESIGFYWERHENMVLDGPITVLWYVGRGVAMQAEQVCFLPHIKTRGDMRRLCVSLGVAMNTTSQASPIQTQRKKTSKD